MHSRYIGAAFTLLLPRMVVQEASASTTVARPQVSSSCFISSLSLSRGGDNSGGAAVDDTVITPRGPNNFHNFGPASSRDSTLFTCERPGGDPDNGKIPTSAVVDWAQFMRKQGIEEVLVLLDDDELECYEEPGLLKLYENNGFGVQRTPMNEVGAAKRAMATIDKCYANDKKIVAHCTHGQGRAGRVAAAWLTYKYNLSVEDATKETLAMASIKEVTRMGSPSKLKAWLDNV